jgi:ribosomal protein S4
VTNSFSHAEHIRERFSNVVLASFDSRLSSLVLRARLEKGKILGG